MNVIEKPKLKNLLLLTMSTIPTNDQIWPTIIGDLYCIDCCVETHFSVSEISKIFERNPEWPGVILTSQRQFVGMLSRQRTFETLGKPFGLEIFSKKTVLEFFNQFAAYRLVLLDANTPIPDAVRTALTRDLREIYDPVIVRFNDHQYGLLTMDTLLLAQNDILEKLSVEYKQLSVIDPLTNLSNRRGFFELAHQQIFTSFNEYTDLSALMIDIDNFKRTNDIYGHFVGDIVIKTVAEECQKALRQTDLLGRFGGEEFFALLPNTSLDLACQVSERLRERVENLVITVNGYQISVTISIGICNINETNGSLDMLLTQADQAMYAAKWAGRNQVMIWDPSQLHMTKKDSLAAINKDGNQIGWLSHIRADASRIYDETIEGWARALEMRDKETEGHAQRVTTMTIELARRIGIKEDDLVDIRRGALLHDIGKIAVPDHILFKPGPLTEEEWDIMRKHPVYAYELLSPITHLQNCVEIPYCHHEHWDGGGYPRKLKGEEIPLAARIFTFIDVWDALRTDRCYRPAWQPQEIRKYIMDESGHLLDPGITKLFLELLDEVYTRVDSIGC